MFDFADSDDRCLDDDLDQLDDFSDLPTLDDLGFGPIYQQQQQQEETSQPAKPTPAEDPAYLPPPPPLSSDFATVPNLFARRSINIIVGDVKTGRTRLALTNLNTYADPLSPIFLGLPVHNPVRLGCILCMRDKDRTLNDLTTMGLDNLKHLGTTPGAGFPIHRWYASEAETSEALHLLKHPYESLFMDKDHRRELGPPPNFLLVENLQSLLPSGNTSNEKEVTIFLDQLRRFCNANDVTVLGTVGTPKATKGYAACHRIKGTSLWADGVDTLISFEEVRASSSNGLTRAEANLYRRLTIIPPGRPRTIQWTRFSVEDGRLLTTETPSPSGSIGIPMLYQMLSLSPTGATFTRVDFDEWGMRAKVSDRTVTRWVGECLKGGQLRKNGHAATTTFTKQADN